MRLLGKTAIVLGMAGAMALGSMTASEARWRGRCRRRAAASWLARRSALRRRMPTPAITTATGYGYDSYAYEPAYSATTATPMSRLMWPAPVYTPPSYYGPVADYDILRVTTPTTPARGASADFRAATSRIRRV